MRHSNTDFVRVDVLVLDEADRMMDMGFWPDVQRIMAALPPDRQTLLFSATLPGEIQRMATDVLKSPRYVQVGKRGVHGVWIAVAIGEAAGHDGARRQADGADVVGSIVDRDRAGERMQRGFACAVGGACARRDEIGRAHV